jgi:hypothetical protein
LLIRCTLFQCRNNIHYSDTWVVPTFLTLPPVAAVPAEQMSA